MKYIYIALLAGSFAATPAAAQDAAETTPDSTISVGVSSGTLGIGPEIGWRLSNRIGFRANAMFLNVSGSFDSDDMEYDGDIKLKSFGAMVDIYPFGGNFRVSGGARSNSNKIDVTATPTGDFEIDGEEYTSTEVGTLTGRAKPRKFSPALTLGWSGQNRKGFMFGIEAGALFQGAFKLDEFRASGTLANNAGFRADLEEERRSLQSDIDQVKVYPILQLAVGYRF